MPLLPDIIHIPDVNVSPALDVQLRELLYECFPEEPKFANQRFNFEKPADRWIIYAGDRLIAHTATHSKSFLSGGKKYDYCGIAEVCVHPQFRRRGLAGHMLEAAEKHFTDFAFSILLGPETTYARYGYFSVPNVVFPMYSPEPVSFAMVKCLATSKWPEERIEIPGPYF